MANSISLAIIDLDDTLVSFDGVSEKSWLDACGQFKNHLNGIAPETAAKAIRAEGDMYWEDPGRHKIGRLNLPYTRRKIVSSALAGLGLHDQKTAEQLADTYSQIRIDAMYLFDGALQTLHALRKGGIKLALLTNGDSAGQRSKINRFNLSPHFDGVYIEEEIRYGKPELQAFERILSDFEETANKTMIVGDNYEWEIRVPATLGMYTIWVNRNSQRLVPDDGPAPDAEIRTIAELPDVVERLS